MSITRRNFLSGLALLVATLVPSSDPLRKSFSAWYGDDMDGKAGIQFQHPSIHWSLSRDQKGSLDDELRRKSVARFSQRIEVMKAEYDSTVNLWQANLPPKAWNEYVTRMDLALQGFIGHLRLPTAMIPHSELIHLTPTTQVQPRTEQLCPIYVVWDVEERVAAKYEVKPSPEIVLRPTVSLTFTPDGMAYVSYNPSRLNGKINVNAVYLPVVVAIGDNPVTAYAALLSEFFHATLSPTTRKHIEDDANVQDEVNTKVFASIVSRWKEREEAVVHGIVDLYIQNKAPELGFDTLLVQKYVHNHAIFPSISKIRNSSLSSSQVIDAYVHNPHSLF